MPSATATKTMMSKRSPLPLWLRWLGLAVVVVLVAIAGTEFLRGPRFVSRVTIANPSPYAVEVEVAGADRDGWMVLGAVQPKSASSVADVIDQGATWAFRVHAQGVDGGEFVAARTSLVRSNWRITIPSEVITRLRAQHIPPSPTTEQLEGDF